MTKSKQWFYVAKPEGGDLSKCFEKRETELAEIKDGQVLLKTVYLSVDPYMRPKMTVEKSYTEMFKTGEKFFGGAILEVVQSKNSDYKEKDLVTSTGSGGSQGAGSWSEYIVSDGKDVRKVARDPAIDPAHYLGVLGGTGLTAYFGLLDLGKPKKGETVLVSGAAGAVGSIVGQIAKIHGCTVVGLVGSDEKAKHLTEDLSFDRSIIYKTPDLTDAVHKTCPQGIDVYFDNTGGPALDAALANANFNARFPICGNISDYNSKPEERYGVKNIFRIVSHRILLHGFIVIDYLPRAGEAIAKLTEWLKSGQIKAHNTIVEGFDNAPNALAGLFKGDNTGKMLVKVADVSK